MKPKHKISQTTLKHHLKYDPESGIFYWRHSTYRTDLIGNQAGYIDRRGYIRIKIGSITYLAHRLAYIYMTGTNPPELIDHKDNNRQNNRWINIRSATHGQNVSNSSGWKKRKIKLPKGVYKHSMSAGYFAMIVVDRKRHYLGSFKTIEEAKATYISAAIKFKGEFARAS